MDTEQVLLEHEATGHVAPFPATADLATWHGLGWQEIPAEKGAEPDAGTEGSGDAEQAPASKAENPSSARTAKRANDSKEQA